MTVPRNGVGSNQYQTRPNRSYRGATNERVHAAVTDPLPPGPSRVPTDVLFTLVRPDNDSGLWEDVITVLSEDPLDRRIVGDLIEQLERHGRFDEPVRIADAEVANGYHRCVAAHLAGYDVDVWVDTDDMPYPHKDSPMCELWFTVAPTEGRTHDEDWFDTACTAARSLPVGDRWFESDGGSGYRRQQTAYVFYCEMTDSHALAQAVVDRLAEHGINAMFERAELVDYSDLDP